MDVTRFSARLAIALLVAAGVTDPAWSANTTPNGRSPTELVPGAPALAPAIAPWEDYQKHFKSRNSIATLGNDLFGDRVDLYTGALSFAQTDVSIPGNSGLEVAIRRKLEIAPRNELLPNDRSFGDWDLDLPKIEGVYARVPGSPTGTSWGTQRCTAPVPPTVVSGTHRFTALDYWSGLQASMPGGGELLAADTSTPKPKFKGVAQSAWRWVTAEHTYLRCLANGASDGHEGFLALARDGTQYWFTQPAQYAETTVDRPMDSNTTQAGQLERRRVALWKL